MHKTLEQIEKEIGAIDYDNRAEHDYPFGSSQYQSIHKIELWARDNVQWLLQQILGDQRPTEQELFEVLKQELIDQFTVQLDSEFIEEQARESLEQVKAAQTIDDLMEVQADAAWDLWGAMVPLEAQIREFWAPLREQYTGHKHHFEPDEFVPGVSIALTEHLIGREVDWQEWCT